MNTVDSADDLDVKIGALDRLLDEMRDCASRGCPLAVDDIRDMLLIFNPREVADHCALLASVLAITLQRLVFDL